MKILLINKFLFPAGGDAISTLETGKLLIRNGHNVRFWGMKHPLNNKFPFEEFFVSYVNYKEKASIFKQIKSSLKILYSLEAKNKISSLMAQWKPDIVHLNNFAHQISPSILDIFKKYKIPCVMTMRDYKLVCPAYLMLLNGRPCEKCKGGRFYNCLFNKCTKSSALKSLVNTVEMYLHHKILHIYNNISIFISPSIFLMEKLKEMGFCGKLVYLPNFVNPEEYEPCYDFNDKTIVYFGRLSEEKGIDTLITAANNLDVEVKIAGRGLFEDKLKSIVKSEKRIDVSFIGYKKKEELKEVIKNSLFTVIPSKCYENNPRAILESFALGKPVVGAAIGGIPELVIDGKTGYTFKVGDGRDLKEKIKYLLNNMGEVNKMGKTARKFVEEKFNPDRHYKKLIDIYNDTIENNSK
jgi:glycosyltransferase involved in cell wall biosynthesis